MEDNEMKTPEQKTEPAKKKRGFVWKLWYIILGFGAVGWMIMVIYGWLWGLLFLLPPHPGTWLVALLFLSPVYYLVAVLLKKYTRVAAPKKLLTVLKYATSLVLIITLFILMRVGPNALVRGFKNIDALICSGTGGAMKSGGCGFGGCLDACEYPWGPEVSCEGLGCDNPYFILME